MKRRLALAWFLLGSVLILIPCTLLLNASASNSGSRAVPPPSARLGSQVTVHAQRRGAPRINLADGREVLTAYTGSPEAQRLLQQNLVQPLGMASADFDEDGVPDLITGYAAPNGGLITISRGNADAIYPNTVDAQQRKAAGTFTDSPFVSPAPAFLTPRPVDFLGSGDFDADGHLDLVTAARGGNSLYFLLGDGRGNLSAPRQLDLPGRVTAFVTGEFNRADGLADIIVGVSGADGPRALVFEAPDGALRANPEVVPLPSEATALALGQLDDAFPMDLAVASGRELMIVRGQPQRSSLNTTNRATARGAVIDRRSFPFAIKSLAIGDFNGNQRDDVALLSGDGAVHVLGRSKAVSPRSGRKALRVQKWQDRTLPGAWPQARRLERARVSSLAMDSLLVIDSTNRRLQILENNPSTTHSIQTSAPGESLDVEGEPIAVVPMRLNVDALSDLVILRRNQTSPSVVTTSPAMTFTVTNTNANGAGSLAQAITSANAAAGADLITFAIGSGPQSIGLTEPLDPITEAITIDATTQPGFAGSPIIEVPGSGLLTNGFVLTAGDTTIRGFVINGFTGDGISISNSGNNAIERNFIGTTTTGTAPAANQGDGVSIDASPGNRIGGTTAAASNLISGNSGAGVEIINGALGNLVQGNFIGTNVTGSAALGNGNSGVALLLMASNSSVGGTTPGAGNLISGNSNSGVVLANNGTKGNLVQNNLIGTNASGTSGLPNLADGVTITGGAADDNTIGGTVAAARNILAFNVGAGLAAASGSGNAFLGNSFFSNSFGINISDDLGVTPNDACDVDAGPNGLQNFPVLTSASSNGATTTIIGSLDSDPGIFFRVEFFSSSACDTSGFGQGRTFLGATSIMTGVSCTAPINVVLPVGVAGGQVITATATNVANDTSEFSACVTVVAVGPTSDLQITNSDSPDPVVSGANITYTITVTNNGPDTDAAVIFNDVLPAGTTFVSLASPGSCSAPSPGGTGTVNCSLGALLSGGSAAISLVVSVSAAPGATITNTATVSGMSSDPNPLNNTATASTTVASGTCTLTCPPNLFASTSPTATSCGTVVPFSPVTTGGCGPVTCAPPSGSVFAVGATTVSCSASSAPTCSFTVFVADDTPPRITCSTGVTANLPPGQVSAVVNYPAPTASDNCGVPSVVCVPPSGSTFPAGATLVTCTARDAFENANRCFFVVTVVDAEPPVIRCPANVSVAPGAGQTSALVTYPPPTATDNFPGVTVVCVPASGSSFPGGSTTVTCTATDAVGNRSSCSFIVGVGGPQVKVTLPANKTAVEFAATASRKPPKPKNNPCALFTVENVGFAPLILTFDSIARTGASVDSGKITDPNDTRFFSLNRVNADQSLTQLDIGAVLTLQPGQSQNLCAKFSALIPALAGKTTGLAASNVLPDAVTSRIVFRQNAGANISVPISARVSTAVVLVNLSNPRTLPEVVFARSGNDITVSYAVFDSNLDVTRAKYEFLDSGGQVVGTPFEIDLAASIGSANLVRGQSFSVEQRFTGASSNPEITGVRVTVFDGETSSSAPSASSASSSGAASVQLMNRARRVTLYPPDLKLEIKSTR